jgi:hypothetical protein
MVSPPPRWFDDEKTTPFLLAFEQARHLAVRVARVTCRSVLCGIKVNQQT